MKRSTVLALAVVLLAGCAATLEQPTGRLISEAEQAVAQAERQGAAVLAPQALREARTQLNKAKGAHRLGEVELARQFAAEAIAHAERAQDTARASSDAEQAYRGAEAQTAQFTRNP